MKKLNNERASLFFDTEEIKNYRKKGQNILRKDEVLAFFFFRPISIYLSAFIINKTQISANSITVLMSLLGLLGVICIIIPSQIQYILTVALVYYLTTYLLDVIDGEVARLRETTSDVGVILDASLWFYYPLAYVVAIYALSAKLDIGIWLPTVVTMGVFHEAYSDMAIRLFNKKAISAKQTEKTILNLIKLIFSKPFYFLFLLIAWGTLDIIAFKYLFVFYTLLISFLYFTNSTVNLVKLIKLTNKLP